MKIIKTTREEDIEFEFQKIDDELCGLVHAFSEEGKEREEEWMKDLAGKLDDLKNFILKKNAK